MLKLLMRSSFLPVRMGGTYKLWRIDATRVVVREYCGPSPFRGGVRGIDGGRKDDLVVDAIADENSDVTTFDRSAGRSADFPPPDDQVCKPIDPDGSLLGEVGFLHSDNVDFGFYSKFRELFFFRTQALAVPLQNRERPWVQLDVSSPDDKPAVIQGCERPQ